jgi:hypothetical protein
MDTFSEGSKLPSLLTSTPTVRKTGNYSYLKTSLVSPNSLLFTGK